MREINKADLKNTVRQQVNSEAMSGKRVTRKDKRFKRKNKTRHYGGR